jgi:hypothetical protein
LGWQAGERGLVLESRSRGKGNRSTVLGDVQASRLADAANPVGSQELGFD